MVLMQSINTSSIMYTRVNEKLIFVQETCSNVWLTYVQLLYHSQLFSPYTEWN